MNSSRVIRPNGNPGGGEDRAAGETYSGPWGSPDNFAGAAAVGRDLVLLTAVVVALGFVNWIFGG